MTDTTNLTTEAAAISSSSSNIKKFAVDAAANLVDLAARVAKLEAAASTPAPTPTPYLFNDEFDGPAGAPPDPTKWVNLDGITYDSATSNAKAKNAYLNGQGQLVLRVTREAWYGKQYAGALIGSYQYQTGWPPKPILGSWQVPFRYEVKFKLPNVAGAWCGPGWLQNVDRATGYVEIDVAETRSTYPTSFGCNMHTWPGDLPKWGQGITGSDGRSNWHVMTCEARSDATTFYLDGVGVGAGFGVQGRFGVLLHNVIADLSSWGSGGQQPATTDPGPFDMLVEYVRVTAL